MTNSFWVRARGPVAAAAMLVALIFLFFEPAGRPVDAAKGGKRPTPTPTASTAPDSGLPTATATPTPTDVPLTSTPTATATPAPVAGQVCPSGVHDSYTTTGPDGKSYPTWHSAVDPSGCSFDHEHGDNPRTSNANPALPPFGYVGGLIGDAEPHGGFKVFVANRGMTNDEGRTMRVDSRIVFHMGTGGPARFDNRFHSLLYDLVAPDGHEVHVQGMADTGVVGSICTRDANHPNRTVVTLPGTGCDLDSPYEIWGVSLQIGDKLTVLVAPSVFDPITLMDPLNHTRLIYTETFFPQFGPDRGCKREGYHGPVYWYNAGGPTVYTTDAYGNLQSNGPLRQQVSVHSDLGIPFTADQGIFKQPSPNCTTGLGLKN